LTIGRRRRGAGWPWSGTDGQLAKGWLRGRWLQCDRVQRREL